VAVDEHSHPALSSGGNIHSLRVDKDGGFPVGDAKRFRALIPVDSPDGR
jgi:hypothetical protein